MNKKDEIMGDLFLAEDARDEASQLMGRVNALHSIWRAMPEIIDEHLIGAVFGFKEARDAELEQLSKESAEHWEWFVNEQNKLLEANKKLDEMEKTIENLQRLLEIKTRDSAAELKGLDG